MQVVAHNKEFKELTESGRSHAKTRVVISTPYNVTSDGNSNRSTGLVAIKRSVGVAAEVIHREHTTLRKCQQGYKLLALKTKGDITRNPKQALQRSQKGFASGKNVKKIHSTWLTADILVGTYSC